jgi:hypothetical protein
MLGCRHLGQVGQAARSPGSPRSQAAGLAASMSWYHLLTTSASAKVRLHETRVCLLHAVHSAAAPDDL